MKAIAIATNFLFALALLALLMQNQKLSEQVHQLSSSILAIEAANQAQQLNTTSAQDSYQKSNSNNYPSSFVVNDESKEALLRDIKNTIRQELSKDNLPTKQIAKESQLSPDKVLQAQQKTEQLLSAGQISEAQLENFYLTLRQLPHEERQRSLQRLAKAINQGLLKVQ